MAALTYPLVDKIPKGVIGTRTMDSSWPGSPVIDQIASARIIEREGKAAGLPPELTAAMIVNARAESNLDPKAKGDRMDSQGRWPANEGFDASTARWRSLGLFQLYENGAGKGMSAADRMDATKNTRRIIKEMWARKGKSPVRGAGPDYSHEDPITAWERGVRDVGHLADMFAIYVEGARWRRKPDGVSRGRGHEYRMQLAAKMFPGSTSRTALPWPGTPLPWADAGKSTLKKGEAPPEQEGYLDWVEDYLPGPAKGWWRGDEEEPSSPIESSARWGEPKPAPSPAPPPRKRRAPAPLPPPQPVAAAMGSWSATRREFGLMTSNGRTYAPGPVPAGKYTLTWSGQPAGNVTVRPNAHHEARVEGSSLRFTK
jgi:hypothetical protein